ncbi:hypothetical protein PPYR_01474 [Photinus pyralis]|uniref:AMP-dependent synthetase/ligase domain-containing protein n=2 Tax=Photinus pyralis TaxID=7054 RepID=A0A5N4B4M6_PHOPY|nr:hypothetical protein PPYR_01474 [Photinus pyralis]
MENLQEEILYENNIIYTEDLDGEPDSRGLGCAYFDEMLKNKDLLAQIDGLTKEKDTFGSLLKKCVRTSMWLTEIGLQYGDVVSLCSKGHLNSCVPHISAYFTGAKVAALDPSFSLAESVHLFRQVMPKVIFVGHESVTLIENVIKEVGASTTMVVFGPTDTHVPFSDLIQPKHNESSFKPVEAHDLKEIALILFSSGTTGLPKGICHTHYSILKTAEPIRGQDLRNELIYSNFPPYWNSIYNKSVRLLVPPFGTNNPWDMFSYMATRVILDITSTLTLCRTPKPKNVDLKSLKSILVTGTTISEEQLQEIRETFPNVLVSQMYGQSEVFSPLTYFDLAKPKHVHFLHTKRGSCRLPSRGTYYKVVDPDTDKVEDKVLGPKQKGEIRVKTQMQLRGYYNLDSSGIWDSDGWLKTGDYGYYDEDYCFYVIDRLKEMFAYRGKHITPASIENVKHPSCSVKICSNRNTTLYRQSPCYGVSSIKTWSSKCNWRGNSKVCRRPVG